LRGGGIGRYWSFGLLAMVAFLVLVSLVQDAWPQVRPTNRYRPIQNLVPLYAAAALAAINLVCMFRIIMTCCWWQKLLATPPFLFSVMFLFACFLWTLEQVF